MKLEQASPTRLIVPAAARSLIMARASEPLTLYLSQGTPRVMQRILGISVCILAQRFSSRKTSLLSLSFTITLVHDFFFAFVLPAFFKGSPLPMAPLPNFPLASLPLASLPLSLSCRLSSRGHPCRWRPCLTFLWRPCLWHPCLCLTGFLQGVTLADGALA